MRISRIFIGLAYVFCFSFLTFGLLTGCVEIKPPGPEEILREPLGQSPLRIGMTKEKIKSLWGKPDAVNVLGTDPQGMIKEEWIYRGRYPNLPINIDYLSETQRLFF
ncbi:unnamed protein product, partial [marine sediment metagenome]